MTTTNELNLAGSEPVAEVIANGNGLRLLRPLPSGTRLYTNAAQHCPFQRCGRAGGEALTDAALRVVYQEAQWAWGGRGDVDAFFLNFARRVEAAHGIGICATNRGDGSVRVPGEISRRNGERG